MPIKPMMKSTKKVAPSKTMKTPVKAVVKSKPSAYGTKPPVQKANPMAAVEKADKKIKMKKALTNAGIAASTAAGTAVMMVRDARLRRGQNRWTSENPNASIANDMPSKRELRKLGKTKSTKK